jgi:Na+-translocating ferredoxin:NAD+ oxidoreductase RnfD subunit
VACKWLFITLLEWLFIKNFLETILKMVGDAFGLITHVLVMLLAPSAPWSMTFYAQFCDD